MIIPRQNTKAYQAAQYVYQNGPQSAEFLMEFVASRSARVYEGQIVINDMLALGQLVRQGEQYGLSRSLRHHFADLQPTKKEVLPNVAPRYVPPFKPWTGKFNFARDTDRHFLTSGTATEPKVRGVAL